MYIFLLQALIVANAYKRTTLADWVNPLYQLVVIKGNMRYLNDFTAVFPITNSIMNDLASKLVKNAHFFYNSM